MRPDVLALPSPTASRTLGLLAAVLTAGMFAGASLHHALPVGRRWLQALAVCESSTFGSTGAADAGGTVNPAFIRCTDPVNSVLAAFEVGGAALALVCCLAVALLMPRLLIRRRRLRPLGGSMAGCSVAVARLAAQAHQAVPELLLGPASARDAFSLGLPGRYRIALPPGLAIRAGRSREFDPIVRHELAHLRRHDVPLAWVSKGVGWVLAAVGTIPLLVTVVTGDASIILSATWRFALITAVAVMVAASILRSREYEADLASGRGPAERSELVAVLGEVRPPPRRLLLAVHPSAARRIAVLEKPTLAIRIGFLDGLTVALLASLAVPMVIGLLSTTTVSLSVLGFVGPSTAGLLLAPTLGLGLFRDALGRRVAGLRSAPVWPVCLGAAAGSFLGQSASLAAVGAQSPGGSPDAVVWLFGAIGYAGATLLAAGVGALSAVTARRLPRSVVTLCCLLISGLLFALVAWYVMALGSAWTGIGWSGLRAMLAFGLGSGPHAIVCAVLVLLIGLLLLAGRGAGWTSPGWASADRVDTQVTAASSLSVGGVLGAAAGAALAASGAIAINRWRNGQAVGEAALNQRLGQVTWMIAVAAVAVMLSLYLVYRRVGLGEAVGAGLAAAFLAEVLFLGQNLLYGGTVDAAFVGYLLRSATGLAALLLLLAAGIIVVAEALRTSSDRPPRRRAASVATALALALGLGLGAVIGVATPVLNPLTPDVATAPTLTAPAGMIESIWYQGFVAPEAHRQVQAAIRPYVALGPNAAPSAVTSTVRDSVLPELVKVRSSMAGLSASDPAVLAAHQHLTTALDGFIDAFGRVAENGDSAAGRDALSAATLEWNAWLQAVAAL